MNYKDFIKRYEIYFLPFLMFFSGVCLMLFVFITTQKQINNLYTSQVLETLTIDNIIEEDIAIAQIINEMAKNSLLN